MRGGLLGGASRCFESSRDPGRQHGYLIGWCPPWLQVGWFRNLMKTIVISAINHSEMGVKYKPTLTSMKTIVTP